MDKKIELRVESISNSLAQSHAYALLLQEVGGERQLPVIIGPAEAQSIAFRLKNFKPPRPFTHDLFVSFADAFDVILKEVFIYKAFEGVFYSYLCFEKEGEIHQVDARTSDAIALALRFRTPIYTTEAIIETESIRMEEGGPISVPITAVKMSLLKEALNKAVKDENYELASQIRDEIHRREQGGLNPEDNLMNL